MLPVDGGWHSLNPIEFLRFRAEQRGEPFNLDLLSETRGNALLNSIRYKQQITRQFNHQVKARPIRLDDWVVRKVEAT